MNDYSQQDRIAFLHWARTQDGFHKASKKVDELFYLNEILIGRLNIITGEYTIEQTAAATTIANGFLG